MRPWRAESATVAGPTLELRDVVFRGSSGLASALSLRSDAERVGLVGEWQPFFRALTDPGSIASGRAQILGREPNAALREGVLGLAACDPPLPGSFTVREYLEHAARLSHGSSTRATSDAQRALVELGLTELSTKKLAQLALYQRRALGVALARLGAPVVVCLETPLRDLDADSADYVARLCAQAARSSRLIVSSLAPSTPSPERALLDECQELFWLERGTLLGHGSPGTALAPSARYVLTLLGSGSRTFVATLSEVGCRLSEQPSPSALATWVAPGGSVTRYLVELPANGSADVLLDAALAAGVTVVELTPVLELSPAS